MSNLVEHAERELKLAGVFDKDADYDGMLGHAVLALVKVFAGQGHSGFSAHQTLAMFDEVARFRILTAISSDPSEWFDHGDGMGPRGEPIWQNKRDPAAFSRDGGKTWYHLDDPDKCNGDVHVRPATS